jgi:hypothetical protein
MPRIKGDSVDFLIAVARNPRLPVTLRTKAAAAAAPFVRPRLNAVELSGPGGGPMQLLEQIALVAVGNVNQRLPEKPAAPMVLEHEPKGESE